MVGCPVSKSKPQLLPSRDQAFELLGQSPATEIKVLGVSCASVFFGFYVTISPGRGIYLSLGSQ